MNRIMMGLCLLALMAAGCKKNKDANAGNILIGKIYQDGLLKVQFFYDGEKRPYKKVAYNISGGTSEEASSNFYSYNATGQMTEMLQLGSNSQFINKYVMLYDTDNRLTKINSYMSNGDLNFYFVLGYSADSRINSFKVYDNTTYKLVVEVDFKYEQDGKLMHLKRYNFMPAKVLNDSAQYVFEKTSFPGNWIYYETITAMMLPKNDYSLFDLILEKYDYTYVDAPPTFSEVRYSGKKYNDAGLVTGQTISRKTTFIGPPTETTSLYTYEYIY